MTPQQKTLILDALRIGHDVIQDGMENGGEDFETLEKFKAAIKELEAMPTEEVK